MTVMAAEAGAGAAEAGASEASAGASQATRSTSRPRAARPQRGRQGPAGRQGTPGEPGRQGGFQRREGGQQRQGGKRPSVKLGKGDLTSYQVVVLSEFVAAILLVAATPFAKKESPGVSPYVGSDLLQLVAITVVYFLLALVSGANRGAGRFAAWFGALVLLTVGLGEAARLAKLLNVFGLSSPPGPQPDSTGTGQAPGTTTAGGRGG